MVIRGAVVSDAPRLQEVRQAAFAPVFASFRALLGEDIYQLAQARSDEAQADYLASLLASDSGWEVYVAEQAGVVVGFVSLQLNRDTTIGEIGLNAVHPDWAGAGIGTAIEALTRRTLNLVLRNPLFFWGATEPRSAAVPASVAAR